MTREDLYKMHEETCKEALEIMKAKNQDYSTGDDPFLNFRSATFFGVHPEIGLMMRCLDKFQRIRAFCENGTLAVAGEPVEDAIQDVINYMILLKGLAREERPFPPQRPSLTLREIEEDFVK